MRDQCWEMQLMLYLDTSTREPPTEMHKEWGGEGGREKDEDKKERDKKRAQGLI